MSRRGGNRALFDGVRGQERAVQALTAGLREDRLSPSLILHGPVGVGKTFLALRLARARICPAAADPPCGACASCARIDPPEVQHPDLRRIGPIGREIRIQQIRELVREAQIRPHEGRRRVFLIEPADRMTTQAANALLKVLEEPPASSTLLLVTPSYHSLLPTVRSRCQAIRLQPVPPETVARFLVGEGGHTEPDAHLIAALTEGRIARAATFDLPAYRKRRERLLGLIHDLRGRRYGSIVIHNAEQLAHSPEELSLDLDALLVLFRDIARLVFGAGESPIANQDLRGELLELAGRFSYRAHHLVARIEETRRDLRRSVNRYLATQVLLFDLAGSGRPPAAGLDRAAPSARTGVS